MGLVDYLLASRDLHAVQFSPSSYAAVAEATTEAFLIWAHHRPDHVRLRGTAWGTSGAGRVDPASSRIDLEVDLPRARAVAEMQGASVLAQNAVSSLVAGVCALLSCQGQYAGTSDQVGCGEDWSVVEVTCANSLQDALRARLAAHGWAGPVSINLSAALAAAVVDAVQRARGRAVLVGPASSCAARGTTASALVLAR